MYKGALYTYRMDPLYAGWLACIQGDLHDYKVACTQGSLHEYRVACTFIMWFACIQCGFHIYRVAGM